MPTAPTGVPTSLSVLQPINNLTWNEVDCSKHNGLITGYTVIISNSSITYSVTSTKRYIILNDLVLDTVYIISVAAVNSAGSGPFSDPIALLLHPSQSSQLPAASVYPSDVSQTYISTSTSNNGVT
ncbi:PREDICTED: contactin-6-like [Amphimedon queenslandica]|uniref:Fibronectin type-III domain-containing protein n=1 Tax=Amphimedon queenslandica TaxID=400682 RepID=A0AAN0JQI5_AMPQE|nr:PREDICTED: contactin-6-like [Amphimedon queenslandica]|eukprot:XP_019859087.1 PREDICTED: contactin-6-like [Amphimedon queenslandica]